MTLSNLRNNTSFFKIDDVATIVNGRKKEEIGYFIPAIFKEEFEKFTQELEKNKKRQLLKKVLNASRKDIVGDGAVDDGIK
jgi:Mg/Co/Ni transporter MgtE